MLIDGFDQHCRYLSAPGGGLQYHFGTYLRQLNVKIEDEQLRTIVRAGWLRPLLRVRLPESFLLSWENYPLLSFKGSFAAEDLWANKLWIRAATMSGLSAENQWYKHYLDDGNCELTKNILMHTIATGPGAQEPEPIHHPRLNRLVYPWIDFFAYWQVYEMLSSSVPVGSSDRFSMDRAPRCSSNRFANSFRSYESGRMPALRPSAAAGKETAPCWNGFRDSARCLAYGLTHITTGAW